MLYDYAVYIGRFQPVTLAHQEIFKQALTVAKKLIIVVGSVKQAPSSRNPFSLNEKAEMIHLSLSKEERDRTMLLPIQDSFLNPARWAETIRKAVTKCTKSSSSVVLMKHYKDGSSFYLDYFPNWDIYNVPTLYENLSATDIREKLFRGEIDNTLEVPRLVKDYLEKWVLQEKFQSLKEDYLLISKYKNEWSNSPYPPTFVTTDAVVTCNNHILLIRRGQFPGKGQLALPGGFLNQDETIENGCVRELLEETRINVDINVIKSSIKEVKTVDTPWRDPRGRCITFAHYIKLDYDYLLEIEASDDAATVRWIPFSELRTSCDKMFNDHFQIIGYFLEKEGVLTYEDFNNC